MEKYNEISHQYMESHLLSCYMHELGPPGDHEEFSGNLIIRIPKVITSLHLAGDSSTEFERKEPVMILGTEDGYILYVTREVVFSKKFFSSRIIPSSVRSPDGKYVIFASSTKLITFPLNLCSVYLSCASCLDSSVRYDSFSCQWNGTACFASFNSSSGENECPPSIQNFELKSELLAWIITALLCATFIITIFTYIMWKIRLSRKKALDEPSDTEGEC